MKSDKFLRALGELDDELIAEYEKSKKQKRRTAILRYTALAASLCLVITATVTAVPFLKQSTATTPGTEATGQSITASEHVPTDPPKAEGEFNIISVAAAKTDGTYISTDTSFIVTAENGSADLVREHLFISGGPEYTVSEGEEENTYNVILEKSLDSGKVVSLSFVNDGVADYSWAFQTESKLQVAGTYPADGATGVAEESVIELEFSHVIASDVSEFVTISPALEGSWEQIGKIHRFIPAAPLAADTDYTVTVSAGITSGEAALEGKHTFTFSTSQKKRHYCYPDTITLDGINTYRTGESIVIRYTDNSEEPSTVGKIELYSFTDVSNMTDYLHGANATEPTLIGDEPFSVEHLYTGNYGKSANLTLERTLPTGYYIAQVYEEDGSHLFEWVIQVHPLTVYAAVTERDVLVWVANADGLAEGVSVRYLDAEATTDGSGLALLEDVTDGSEDTGYLYIGEEEAPLTVALENYTHEDYPAGYIYTDRPIYKATDTIQVWGCIPLDLFYDEPDGIFTLSLGSEEKIEITPDEDGTFSASFEINKHTMDSCRISLYYNGVSIASRSIKIEDYELQNYFFDIITDSNYAPCDGSFDFGVKVTHISGVTVSGKKVRVEFDDTSYYATTGDDGIALFSLPADTDYGAYYSDYGRAGSITCNTVKVYNGDLTEGAAMEPAEEKSFYTVRHDSIARISEKNNYVYLKYNGIDTTGVDDIVYRYEDGTEYYNVIADPLSTTGSITVRVIQAARTVTGHEYDPYTKTTKPVYSIEKETEYSSQTVEFAVENGEATIDLSHFALPERTETKRYYLKYTVSVNMGTRTQQFADRYSGNNSGYLTPANQYSSNYIHQDGASVRDSYNLYSYCFAVNGTVPTTFEKTYTFTEGESIDLALTDLSGEFTPSGGKVLRLIYGRDIKDAALFQDSDVLDFTCDEQIFPSAKVTGAYYLNGVFYRMPYTYLQVDTEERTVDVSIKTDKSSYAPGSEVTLSVSTTDKDGNPLPCTVNVSVVNEAVFAGNSENIRPADALLKRSASRIYPAYAFTSYRDYDLFYESGGWGDGGGDYVRSDFGDTAAFKTVKTDGSGNATVTFTLPDSVTEYRITAHAASGEMYYGANTASFTTNMDFFLQFAQPRAVKDTDDLVLNANTVSGVSGTVDLEFTIKETGATLTASAPTGAGTAVNFGKLPAGSYTAGIKATCGEYTDAVEFPFEIVRGAVAATVNEDVDLSSTLTLTPASYPVTLDIYTESTQKYLELFDFLQNNMSPRFDTLMAGQVGMVLKNKLLGKEDLIPSIDVDSDYYGDNALKMLPTAEEDIILTALHTYFSGGSGNYGITSSPIGKGISADELLERLMCSAADGDAVLTDLQSVESYVTDDAYQQTVLSISYAMLGDYEGAKRLYDAVTGESDEEGYEVLRAIAATFVDKKNAGAMIDALIEKDPAAPYLSYAVYAYLASCADVIKEEQTLTVSYGDVTESVSVSGLETKTLTLTGEGALTVDFETESESVCAAVTYESSDPPAADGAFTAYIEGEAKKSSTVELVIDFGALPCDSGFMDIVLPACLRYCGSAYPADGVGVSAKSERLAAYRSSISPSVVRIPLVVINEGEYVFESVIFTYGGQMYRSDAFTVNAAK